MPLDDYAEFGQPIELQVPWLPATVWFVPDRRHVDILTREGISRGRIFTAAELQDLLRIPGLTSD
jgi:hypothetical protein